MTCEGTVLGSVVRTLPLLTRVGFPPVSSIFEGLGWPSPYFGRVGFDVDSMANLVLEYSNGTLYMVPQFVYLNPTFNKYRFTMWLDTGVFSGDETVGDVPPEYGQTFFDMRGDGLVWPWLPVRGGDNDWTLNFQAYDFGESGSPSFFFILVEWNSDGTDTGGEVFINIIDGLGGPEETVFVSWDPEEDGPMWVRVREDSGTVFVDLSSGPCVSGGWTNYASLPLVYSSVKNLSLEFTMDADSSEAGGGSGGLSRTSTGLIERFHFNHFSFPFDTGDWTSSANVDGISIDGNGMLNVDVSGRGSAYRSALSRTESLIYARGAINSGENHGWVGIAAHFADPSNLVDMQVAFAGGSAGYALLERVGGSVINIDQPTATTRSKSFETNLTLWLDASEAEARASEAPPNDEAAISLSSLSSGPVGLMAQPISASDTVARFSHWVVMSSRYVTVTGVASGRIVRVRLADDTVVGQATSTGGDTLVDVIEGSWASGEIAVPSNIAIFESDGTTLVAELNPSGAVWGGDEYEFTSEEEESSFPEVFPGFIGPINPQRREFTLALLTHVREAQKVLGSVVATLPLITVVEELSP